MVITRDTKNTFCSGPQIFFWKSFYIQMNVVTFRSLTFLFEASSKDPMNDVNNFLDDFLKAFRWIKKESFTLYTLPYHNLCNQLLRKTERGVYRMESRFIKSRHNLAFNQCRSTFFFSFSHHRIPLHFNLNAMVNLPFSIQEFKCKLCCCLNGILQCWWHYYFLLCFVKLCSCYYYFPTQSCGVLGEIKRNTIITPGLQLYS